MPDGGLSRSCLVCDGPLRPAAALPGLMRCGDCGFVTAGDAPSAAELRRLYGPAYFDGAEYADYVGEAETLQLNFRRRLATLERFVPAPREKALFEIGCAHGFFLKLAAARFRSVAGVDLSAHAASHARDVLGLAVRDGDFLEVRPGAYDVCCLWDTIEHLSAPHLYVEKIARELPPGGFLALTTGDLGSPNARWRGRRWRMIHPPTHLHYFSVATMTHLLSRHGFDVVHVEHPGNARTLRSILYIVLALRARRPRLYGLFAGLRVLDLAVTLNLFDIMYVIARRRTGGAEPGAEWQDAAR